MGRIIFRSLGVLFFLCFIFLGVLWLFRVPLVNMVLSDAVGVHCQVSNISVTPSRFTIEGLTIRNPSGTPIKQALRIKKMQLNGGIFNIARDRVEYEKLLVESPYFGIDIYSQDGSDNNWSRFLSTISQEKEEDALSDRSDTVSREYVIDHVQVKDIQVEAHNPYLDNPMIQPDPIPEVNLYNINTSNPEPIRILISIISQALLNEIMKNYSLGHLLKNVEKVITDTIKNGFNELNGNGKGTEGDVLKKLLPQFGK